MSEVSSSTPNYRENITPANQDELCNTTPNIRRFYLFKCEQIRDTDRRRGGLPHRKGCGRLGIKRTAVEPKQANCKHCGYRPRLNPKTRAFHVFDTLEAAETALLALEEHGVALTPETVEQAPQPPQNRQISAEMWEAINGPQKEVEWF